jgi:hypothetical protein
MGANLEKCGKRWHGRAELDAVKMSLKYAPVVRKGTGIFWRDTSHAFGHGNHVWRSRFVLGFAIRDRELPARCSPIRARGHAIQASLRGRHDRHPYARPKVLPSPRRGRPAWAIGQLGIAEDRRWGKIELR